MSSSGPPASKRQDPKELDTMKESISDIINQLQDIDPARLSFSPFLDLDTQISMAPVSDSPESSVEELHSPSHSISGSQHSLELPPATDQTNTPRQHRHHLQTPEADQTKAEKPDQIASTPSVSAHALDTSTENCIGSSTPASQGDIPNGTDIPRWSPESPHLDSTMDEARPLIGPPPESVELAVWSSERPEEAAEEATGRRGCCCRCKSCGSGRVPALLSGLASIVVAAGILYALFFHVPIRPPDCPDTAARILFTLCCCAVATLPILLAMLAGAMCQFCSGSFHLQEPLPRRRVLQKLFVTTSAEQLLLYSLNLIVMAALLPQDHLKLVPMLVALFIFGRLVYWCSLNACSSWRAFGSGLTVFPLIAMVALNLYLMYILHLREPLFVSQDVLYNQATPSSWSKQASQNPSSKPDVAVSDILDSL